MPFDQSRCIRAGLLTIALATFALVAARPLSAGNGFFRNGAVGGVAIDANGVVSEPTTKAAEHLRKMMMDQLQDVDPELNAATELRRVSLRGLSEVITSAAANGTEIPDEVKYLAGIQRVKYVLVYPEQRDIVLAGPGEGWKLNDRGDVVGVRTGLPVLHLDDLLVALRTTQQAREVGVSCSIDPTEEGTRRMQAVRRKYRKFSKQMLTAIEQAMGPQRITLSGIPETSHFARVLVAADYRMKRIAMDLEQSPLRQLPSFLDMLAHTRTKMTNMTPRWWLACDYEPLARTDDGLGWELRGPGVKVMTEDDFVAADGSRAGAGHTNPLAQKWADTMTANYEELATRSPIFGQLRNLMDLSVIAAVIDKNGLAEKAGCDLSALTRSDSDVVLEAWNPPKTVATQCSFTKQGRNYLITASGGVQIESWQVADRSQVDTRVKQVYQKATKTSDRWWQ